MKNWRIPSKLRSRQFYDECATGHVFALWRSGFDDGEKHLYLGRCDLEGRGNGLDTRGNEKH